MFQKLIQHSRRINRNKFPILASLAKCTEELGEFAEASMYNMGYLQHKQLKETPFAEAADVIICVVDTLAAQYPELSVDYIQEALEAELTRKQVKWIAVSKDWSND